MEEDGEGFGVQAINILLLRRLLQNLLLINSEPPLHLQQVVAAELLVAHVLCAADGVQLPILKGQTFRRNVLQIQLFINCLAARRALVARRVLALGELEAG